MARQAAEQLKNLGLDIDPRARLGDFPIGVQQLVELARVLFSGARIIILDEPTSALSPPEIARLFAVLRRVRESGRGLVFISHFLDDILEISDEVSVFRNGRRVAHAAAGPGVDKALDHREHDRRRPRGTRKRATSATSRSGRACRRRWCWRRKA